ncbi:MAG: helix-turn-helix transcriptional regulator [Saprospiraceae bacterium]|nr:helix-turn-helix transcriptional regulator [Saprospiraceae bacterium]MBK7810278.1 helix-turn-helix transcriptional regulator [Saprospiraceae bacterium]MBK9629881.1 helix-turn-helix transcriptional regulator [Saprospiraceae bacterium]
MSDKLTADIFSFIEKTHYVGKKDFIDDIAKLLNVQKSSVYKKIRGESALTPDDIAKLGKQYQLSLDDLLGLQQDRIYFDFPALNGVVKNVMDYLNPIEFNIKRVQMINPTIYYTSREIPIFYYYTSPKLAAFKFHVFYNINWRDEKFKMTSFQYTEYETNADYLQKIKSISDTYLGLNSIEVWNITVFDNTLNQIRYFLESGLMSQPEEALILHDEIKKLIEKLQEACDTNSKLPFARKLKQAGELTLYNNEIAFTGNLIYVKSESIRTVYSTFDNPNFLNSFNPRLCDYTDKWLQRVINNSIRISGGNTREKNIFFHKILDKVERSRKLTESWLENNSNPAD